jgi:hypothetical protein
MFTTEYITVCAEVVEQRLRELIDSGPELRTFKCEILDLPVPLIALLNLSTERPMSTLIACFFSRRAPLKGSGGTGLV